jgi:hypothetical protein
MWVAFRSFLVAVGLVLLLGIVLACISYMYLVQHHWVYGLIGAAVALFEAIATAFLFGVKCATAMAAAYGCGKLGLGRAAVGLLFERILGVTRDQAMGQRGSALAQGIERLPLAQAENLLAQAVESATGPDGSGWLRDKVRSRLLGGVADITLSRFREQDALHGGVDLLHVKERLEQSIDASLVHKLHGAIRLWTTFLLLGLPFAVAAQTTAVMLWLRSHH